MNSRFSTLLLREWMQHKRGWIVTLLAPPAIVLAMLPFGEVNGVPADQPLALGMAVVMATALSLLAISSISTSFQLSGLARRDVQDRSIEFWLSLPASHSESIGATLAAHLLLVPAGILLGGYALGFVMTAGVAAKLGGVAALAQVPWFQVLAATLPVILRVLLGVPLALLWLAPLVMLLMNASAWLKRWGIPALVAALIVACAIVPKVYDIHVFADALREQVAGAGLALLGNGDGLEDAFRAIGRGDSTGVGSWVAGDAMNALRASASVQFVGGLVLAAAGFALLILRRRRGA